MSQVLASELKKRGGFYELCLGGYLRAISKEYTMAIPNDIAELIQQFLRNCTADLFKECDLTGDGRISEGEMKRAVTEFSGMLTNKNVCEIERVICKKGPINYDQFRALMVNTKVI